MFYKIYSTFEQSQKAARQLRTVYNPSTPFFFWDVPGTQDSHFFCLDGDYEQALKHLEAHKGMFDEIQ